MKQLFIAFIIFSSLPIYAQPISYADWQAEAKKDSRLLPEYGGIPRTKEQHAEDEAYIKTATDEMHATRHDGSEQLIALGFNYYGQGDTRVAMYRFNQAWLLDPQNPDVFAGFGAIYLRFGDLDAAMKYYDKGLALNPKNTNLLTDKATSYMAKSVHNPDTSLTGKAFRLLKTSYALEPKQPSTSYMLSRYYIKQNNCDSAVKYYNACEIAGGQPITEKYTDFLKKHCNVLDK